MTVPYDIRWFRQRHPLDLILSSSRNLLASTHRLDALGGDAVRVGRGRASVIMLRHPDLIRALLIENNADVTKARGMRLLKLLVGEGLLSSETPKHTRQRRLVLPAFHHQRLRAYGDVMVAQSAQTASLWRDGRTVDVTDDMNRLALAIAGETLFGSALNADAARLSDALELGMRAFDRAQFPLADKLMVLPLPNANRGRHARAVVDEVVYRLIRQRRDETSGDGDSSKASGRHEDLLQMLLDAQDEDTGVGMTDEEVRDEAVTLLMAGHETTANALAWTWMHLSQNPEAEARLHSEVDALDGDPTFGDLRALPYTRQVFAESMRLHPPAWIFGREAAHDFSLDGIPIAKGTTFFVAPYFLHRDPRLWRDPRAFDPSRFTPEAKAERHKFAYMPFSFGKRGCIGESFAWAEGVLVLATIARHWRLRLDGPPPAPHGSVTLRPASALKMYAHARFRV